MIETRSQNPVFSAVDTFSMLGQESSGSRIKKQNGGKQNEHHFSALVEKLSTPAKPITHSTPAKKTLGLVKSDAPSYQKQPKPDKNPVKVDRSADKDMRSRQSKSEPEKHQVPVKGPSDREPRSHDKKSVEKTPTTKASSPKLGQIALEEGPTQEPHGDRQAMLFNTAPILAILSNSFETESIAENKDSLVEIISDNPLIQEVMSKGVNRVFSGIKNGEAWLSEMGLSGSDLEQIAALYQIDLDASLTFKDVIRKLDLDVGTIRNEMTRLKENIKMGDLGAYIKRAELSAQKSQLRGKKVTAPIDQPKINVAEQQEVTKDAVPVITTSMVGKHVSTDNHEATPVEVKPEPKEYKTKLNLGEIDSQAGSSRASWEIQSDVPRTQEVFSEFQKGPLSTQIMSPESPIASVGTQSSIDMIRRRLSDQISAFPSGIKGQFSTIPMDAGPLRLFDDLDSGEAELFASNMEHNFLSLFREPEVGGVTSLPAGDISTPEKDQTALLSSNLDLGASSFFPNKGVIGNNIETALSSGSVRPMAREEGDPILTPVEALMSGQENFDESVIEAEPKSLETMSKFGRAAKAVELPFKANIQVEGDYGPSEGVQKEQSPSLAVNKQQANFMLDSSSVPKESIVASKANFDPAVKFSGQVDSNSASLRAPADIIAPIIKSDTSGGDSYSPDSGTSEGRSRELTSVQGKGGERDIAAPTSFSLDMKTAGLKELKMTPPSELKSGYQAELQEVVNKIIDRADLHIKRGGGTANLILKPDELGTLNLKVQVAGNHVKLDVIVESSDVRKILEQNMDHLKAALLDQNVQFDSVNITVGGESFSGKRDSDGGEWQFEESFSQISEEKGKNMQQAIKVQKKAAQRTIISGDRVSVQA